MSGDDVRSAVDRALGALEAAKVEVISAERELERLLNEMKVSPRAEKSQISATIEAALRGLRSARVKVEDAESSLARAKASDE